MGFPKINIIQGGRGQIGILKRHFASHVTEILMNGQFQIPVSEKETQVV